MSAHIEPFAAETSNLTGESKASIKRHIARAEGLGDDIKEVVGTSPARTENETSGGKLQLANDNGRGQ